MLNSKILAVLLLFVMPLGLGCEAESAAGDGGKARPGGGGDRRGRGGGFGGFDPSQAAAIPVDVALVVRRDISDYLETNGTLEAENEVDIVTRASGPIVELTAEEGDFVQAGQLLARIDSAEIRAQLGIARVNLEEARVNLERAKLSQSHELISRESFDQIQARYDSAAAQIQGNEIQLGYTEIKAPFAGLIIARAVKFAEFVSNNARLFRLSDFDPLLCPIQVPEKDIRRVRVGQVAYITVEADSKERYLARVLRVNPVVDSASGTVKVTLAVDGRSRLRPGMFASVFLETEVHEAALVVPKTALVLESIGDSLYVVEGDKVARRDVETGYAESDAVEILSGVAEGEKVVVVGQDALTDGSPVQVLAERAGASKVEAVAAAGPGSEPGGRPAPVPAAVGDRRDGAAGQGGAGQGAGQGGAGQGGGPHQGFGNIDWNDPKQVDRMKGMMRQRGLTEQQIDERIKQMKDGTFRPPGGPPGGSGPR